jgi:hypothetical protein
MSSSYPMKVFKAWGRKRVFKVQMGHCMFKVLLCLEYKEEEESGNWGTRVCLAFRLH